jgi:hypothetical protein
LHFSGELGRNLETDLAQVRPAGLDWGLERGEKERAMSTGRVLVGTRKGAFILTSDGRGKDWQVSGLNFAGWEIDPMKMRQTPPGHRRPLSGIRDSVG